ncbi:hypothetical protein MASR2M78_06970 [Treponema sp.]
MMYIFKMAFKNLWRYKKRTLITAGALAIGLVSYIFVDSFMMGWFDSTKTQYLEYEVASGRIVKKTWWADKERMPLSQSIEEPAAITSILDELGIAYTSRTEFGADLIFYKDPFPEDGSYPARVVAVDSATDGQIFALSKSIDNQYSRGSFVQEGDDGLVIGNNLADKLGMKVGYPVRLQFTAKSGYQEILDTKVIGIIKSDSNMVNVSGVFLSADTADYYLEMEGAVSGIAIKVPGGREGKAKLAALRSRLDDEYQLLGYNELASDFVAVMQTEGSFAFLLVILVLVIAAVGVTNTMMMAIFERRREIGMLRAQGLTDGKIQLMFSLEAGGIGLVGTIIGLALGALVNIPLVNYGLDFGALMNVQGDVVDFGTMALDSKMRGIWSLKPFLISAFFAISVSSLVAFFPTQRMLKSSIPDNLRMD